MNFDQELPISDDLFTINLDLVCSITQYVSHLSCLPYLLSDLHRL